MDELTEIQARVVGCLMEKKETTPEQYPLTLNAFKNACNQKTARNPVTAYNEGEIGHTLRELESLRYGGRTIENIVSLPSETNPPPIAELDGD